MTLRRPAPVALFAACLLATPAAAGQYTTDNFVVDAPTKELAKAFGEAAEKFRREKAIDWLGKEMPRWPQRCPLSVQVNPHRTGGATTFTFTDSGGGPRGVKSQYMEIFGDVTRMLTSVLPHEVTHTVFAHRFGRPVPRWADEGGSVLSENDQERFDHDVKARQHLSRGQAFRFTQLFQMSEYPQDQHTLYAQGYSVCQYLVDRGGKKQFLDFVEVGMKRGARNWDEAAKLYGFDSTDDMQLAWIEAQRSTAPQRVARGNNNPGPVAALTSARGAEVRTSPATVPLLDPPVAARGATPAERTSGSAPDLPPAVRLGPPELPTRR